MNDLIKILKNKTINKRMLVIFPHPDDESMGSGGLLILAKKYGWQTTVVTLTSGEAGQCYINRHGKTLKQIRNTELQNATQILKVDKLILGDFKDSKLRKSSKKMETWLTRVLKTEKPDIVVTYDPSGFSGHPDHIQLSISVLKIIKLLKVTPELFWVSVPGFLSTKLVNKLTLNYFLPATYKLNLGFAWYRKLQAVRQHRSQKLEEGKPLLFLYLAILHTEWYHKADLSKDYNYKFVDFEI